MAKTRVLVIEDSLTVRKRMVEVLAADPDLEIAGALDVLDKPQGNEPGDAWEKQFVSTIKLLARIKVIMHPRARLGLTGQPPGGPASLGAAPRGTALASLVTERPAPQPAGSLRAVAIGVSTGGPAGLIELLRGLPHGFLLPLLLVIHIGKLFASAFAEWLGAQSPFRVAYAADGDPLPPVGESRVLLLSTEAEVKNRVRAMDAAADGYIAKFPDFDILKARLRAQLRRKHFEDENRSIREQLVRGETEAIARKPLEAEQKKLDQLLRDQQFYTRSLIESNIDALTTTDPLGIITDVNKQMEALSGCARGELIGTPFKNYFSTRRCGKRTSSWRAPSPPPKRRTSRNRLSGPA